LDGIPFGRGCRFGSSKGRGFGNPPVRQELNSRLVTSCLVVLVTPLLIRSGIT